VLQREVDVAEHGAPAVDVAAVGADDHDPTTASTTIRARRSAARRPDYDWTRRRLGQ
jgi:hypothetical protein